MTKRVASLLGLLGLGTGTAAYANADYTPSKDVHVLGKWDNALAEDTPRLTNWDMWKARRILNKATERLTNDDVDVGVDTGLHRVSIPKDDLNLRALQYLDFAPSLAAIPERGQEKLRTFRQKGTNLHLHQHPKQYFVHKDTHPSFNMALEATKGKPLKERLSSIKDSLTHITHEGVPGALHYITSAIKGDNTFEEHMAEKNSAEWIKYKPREGNTLVPMRFEKAAGGYTPLITEVVETNHNAILGLSNIKSIPEDYGMLFKEANGFWMPGVNFDLDIVYMDKQGQVQQVQRMVKVEGGMPPVYRPEKTAALALETRPGWCERNNIKVGDKLTVNGD